MSIIRNSSGSNALRIVAFGSNGEIPKTNASGAVSNSGYIAREYIQMDGYTNLITPDVTTSVVILADIPYGINAYLMCDDLSPHQYAIQILNGVVRWTIGNTTTVRAWESGIHIYAIVMTQDGLKAMYDGEALGNAGVPASAGTYIYFGGDGTVALSGVKIYKVIAYSPISYGGNKQFLHFYPCSSYMGEAKFYESRYFQNGFNITGANYELGDVIKYGISIDDIREVAGSSYKSLIECIYEDDGNPQTGADSAETLTQSSESRRFAFALGNTARTDVMSYPSGWTLAARPAGDALSYSKGELIRGRNPKWNLWRDGIDWGKVVYVRGNVPQEIYLSCFAKDTLQWWEGYNNGAVHAPGFEITETVTAYFHNTVGCRCNADSLVKLYGTGTSTVRDNMRVFYYSTDSDGATKMKLGNLASWYTALANLSPHDKFHGMAVVLSKNFTVNGTTYYDVPFSKAQVMSTLLSGTQRKAFSTEYLSQTAMLDLFRSGLENNNDKIFPFEMIDGPLYSSGKTIQQALSEEISGGSSVSCNARIVPISHVDATTEVESSDFVNVDRILVPKTSTVSGNTTEVLDPDTPNVTAYRCILHTRQLGNYYVYPVRQGESNSAKTAYHESQTVADNAGVCFFFSLLDKPLTDTTAQAVVISQTITATIKVTSVVNSSVRVHTFTKTCDLIKHVNSHWATPNYPPIVSGTDRALWDYQTPATTRLPGGGSFLSDMDYDYDDHMRGFWLTMSDLRQGQIVAAGETDIPETMTVEITLE